MDDSIRAELMGIYKNLIPKYPINNINVQYFDLSGGNIYNQTQLSTSYAGTNPLIDGFQSPINSSGNIQTDFRNQFMLKDPKLIEDTLRYYYYLLTQHDPLSSSPMIPARLSAHKHIHLIYAYLLENTRISQIFEKILYNYLHNENLGIASYKTKILLRNTEYLFFDRNPLTSKVREDAEAVRRNAYYRLFGMDLSFGNSNNPLNTSYNYHKSEISNNGFISLFEKLLKEFWQGYINALNTTTTNTRDDYVIEQLIRDLHYMLMGRRTHETATQNMWKYYDASTLSWEEFHSVMMMFWFFEIIDDVNSPLIEDLNAHAVRSGYRLINLGKKVNLSAHTKSQELIDLSIPMARLLRTIERLDINNTRQVQAYITNILARSVPPPPPTPLPAPNMAQSELLTIVNLWERTTGHRIKETVGQR